MTDEYRQKLLNWFASILQIMAFAAAAAVILWFFHVPNAGSWGRPPRSLIDIAGAFAEILLVYPVLFVPVAIWHLFDFLQIRDPASRLGKFAVSYRTFAIAVAATGSAVTLIAAKVFFVPCTAGSPANQFGFIECPRPYPEWLSITFWALSLLLAIICLWKGTMSVYSRRKVGNDPPSPPPH